MSVLKVFGNFFFLISFHPQAQGQTLPPAPIFQNQVEQVNNDEYLHPVIPSLRSSEDGRIGVNNVTKNQIEFFLFAPEKIKSQFLESPSGVNILANDAQPYVLPESFVDAETPGGVGFATLCDPTKQFNLSSVKNNPYICGTGNLDDCYDLELINVYRPSEGETRIEIYQTPITVRVTHPKTENAKIVEITKRSSSFKGATYPGVDDLFEPFIVGEDKKLFVGRVSGARLTWDNKGESVSQKYDIIYSHANNSFEPCDTRGFQKLYPISHAPYDENINNKYGFAKLPFRDTKGNPIADGVDIGGTYPWIDKKANNLSLMGVPSKLFNYNESTNQVITRYETQCVTENCLHPSTPEEMEQIELPGRVNGYIMMGLWTNGKMVYMDTPLMGADYTIRLQDKNHRLIKLYKNGPNDGYVRIGAARDNNSTDTTLASHTGNTSLFESTENYWNHLPNLIPRSPRDVVWNISNAQRTDEFAFDDYLSFKVLINSPMNAALEWNHDSNRPYIPDFFVHKDGFNESTLSFSDEIELQNAATTTHWKTPSHGMLIGGKVSKARTEPVPQGGIKGKGFFTYNNLGIRYNIPSLQTNPMTGKAWWIGFYYDARHNDDGKKRQLLKFPNNDKIYLNGLSSLTFEKSNGTTTIVNLNKALNKKNWHHLGFQINSDSSWVGIYLDGFQGASYSNPNPSIPAFQVNSGNLEFGRGLYGWVDEFKVIQTWMNFEEACNQADGSLLGLKSDYNGPLRNLANQYPNNFHKKVADKVSFNSQVTDQTQFVCNVDYSSALGANTRLIPIKTFSIKQDFLFPEGPLVYSQSRPDSTSNNFCLYCHSNNLKQGLTVDALEIDPFTIAEKDRRRQPMQALRRIFGNIPADYLHNNTLWQPETWGIKVDQYMHPEP